jgi:hypothetical protein
MDPLTFFISTLDHGVAVVLVVISSIFVQLGLLPCFVLMVSYSQ